jgi:hypothetical protein
MRFAPTRMAMLAVGFLVSLSALFGQSHYQIVQAVPENPVTETQLSDLNRRIETLEAGKMDARLVRIETLLEQTAKASEASRQTMVAVLVPVSLLTLEALFRLGSALPLRKKQ